MKFITAILITLFSLTVFSASTDGGIKDEAVSGSGGGKSSN